LGKCAANKPEGAKCKARAMKGSRWCYNHDPHTEAQRKRNAAKGGRTGGRGRPSSASEVVELRQKLRQLAEDTLNGRIEVNVAAVVNQIYNSQLRALEQQRRDLETDELAEKVEELLERTQEAS
jgi:hypothetical protein